MNPIWQTFLISQGAVIEDGITTHFDNLAQDKNPGLQDTALCDLSQTARLRVTGTDAQSFLQNLLSNDIKEVSRNQAQRSSFNSAKGRMLANFLIWRDQDDYILQLPVSLRDALQKRLSMYVLRAKVTITIDESVALGVSGLSDEATDNGLLSIYNDEALQADVIKIAAGRYQYNTTTEQAPALWQTLAKKARPAASLYWDWLDIRAGIVNILPATQEQFVPQMVNLDLTGGINFKKGCYPGQEIVARMHYLGKLKRRMYLAHIATATSPGDELYSTDLAGQSCGMIANSAAAPCGGYDVLAVIQTESQSAHPVHLGSLQGACLTFEPLPYPLPES